MEVITERTNLNLAYERVVSNGGAPGIDGMTVDDLKAWCRANSGKLIGQLLEGSYEPQPVRGKKIPKPGGGERQLGIPTVVDRLVQQAIGQVLTPLIDPTFSAYSYGFRPGRSAHQAVHAGAAYVAEGRRIVVDIDLEKFFDRVNHDILMARLARHVADKRLLRIVRRFLEAGMMQEGVFIPTEEGTPQGGPLTPLLANLLLDDLDKELDDADTASPGTATTATSMCSHRRPASACWRASQPSSKERSSCGSTARRARWLPAIGGWTYRARTEVCRPYERPTPAPDPS